MILPASQLAYLALKISLLIASIGFGVCIGLDHSSRDNVRYSTGSKFLRGCQDAKRLFSAKEHFKILPTLHSPLIFVGF